MESGLTESMIGGEGDRTDWRHRTGWTPLAIRLARPIGLGRSAPCHSGHSGHSGHDRARAYERASAHSGIDAQDRQLVELLVLVDLDPNSMQGGVEGVGGVVGADGDTAVTADIDT